MNKIVIGLGDKTLAIDPTKPGFLLIDDGPIADHYLDAYDAAKEFDPFTHSFNPLPMSYRDARDFAEIAFAGYGKDTLTVRNGKRALVPMLMASKRLDKIKAGKSDADKEAHAIIEDILLSPVLKNVFCKPTNFSFRSGTPPSSIVARIDRRKIGDHDARILGAVLISQFKGQIIVPDLGFYGRPFHTSLIREERLIAGVYSLSELSDELLNPCLLMEKEGRQCTYDDAVVLAQYKGLVPDTQGFRSFVGKLMA